MIAEFWLGDSWVWTFEIPLEKKSHLSYSAKLSAARSTVVKVRESAQ